MRKIAEDSDRFNNHLIGLFGGTFDPIHFGHLRAAIEVCEALNLHEVWFVPAACPPHKTCLTPFHHRETMVKLAILGHNILRCIDIESERAGPSYSVDTLKFLSDERSGLLPFYEFFFIMGVEQFQEITTWKDYDQLLDYAHLVVINRGWDWETAKMLCLDVMHKVFPDYRPCDENMVKFNATNRKDIYLVQVTRLDISSSMIRTKLNKGASVEFLTDDRVIDYITRHNLYKNRE